MDTAYTRYKIEIDFERELKKKKTRSATGSSDFTLKSLLRVNWQQRFYDEMAAAS